MHQIGSASHFERFGSDCGLLSAVFTPLPRAIQGHPAMGVSSLPHAAAEPRNGLPSNAGISAAGMALLNR